MSSFPQSSGRSRDDQQVSRALGKLLPLLYWLAPVFFLGVFYFYPLGSILQVGLGRAENLQAVVESVLSAAVWDVLGFTIWQASLSTFLTLLVGLPGSYLLARYDFPGKNIFKALTGVPFVLPTLVVATAFNSLLGPRGWLNLTLMQWFNAETPPINFTNTLTAILVAHVFYNTTIVLRIVGDFWSRLDPNLANAARALGASRWRALTTVVLPLLMPAIVTAALLVFIFDFTSFGVVLVLGGPRFATLEVEIFYQTTALFNLPMASVLSIIQLVFTLGLTVLYTRLSSRVTRPLSLRPERFTRAKLHSWRSRLAAGALIFSLLMLLVLPLVSLAARSVTRLEPDRRQLSGWQEGLTLDFYRELAADRQQSLFIVSPWISIAISLGYAAATVGLSLGLGLPAAWALARNSGADNPLMSLFNRFADPLLMLPLGTSAVTLGLGFVISLNRPPLDLRASPLLIPLAHTLVAFPFVVRSLVPALQSIQPRLRHAAAILGASPRQVAWAIDFPLVGRAVFVAATFAFTISLGEFGATAILARPEYPTVPVAIYRFLSRPGGLNYGQALALSTILMLICMAGMLAIERFRVADIGEF